MTPEQEEQVRRALAETARHEEVPPMPPEVTARLDGVLSELVAPRVAAGAGTDDGAGTDELAVRRRRRWPNALGVAAAVSVIAVAGAAVATGGFGRSGSSDSTTADAGASTSSTVSSDAAGSGADERSAPEAAAPPDGGIASSPSTGPGAGRSLIADAATPRLRTATLTQDVQRVVDEVPGPSALKQRQAAGESPSDSATSSPSTAPPCVAPVARSGERLVDVLLDGRPATLLLGKVLDGSRAARVYSCDDAATPVASTTVQAR